MTFDDLLSEFEGPERIGQAIWDLLVEVTGRVCRRYPARVYADDSGWNESSIADLAQSVALVRLIGESQLDYILTQASEDPARGLEIVSGLLAVQVSRTLAHRRSPSVVDRLVRRVGDLLRTPQDGINTRDVGAETWIYGPTERSPAALTPAERHRGVHRIADIPRIPSNPRGERESKVYSSSHLVDLVHRLIEEYDGIYLGDVRRILEDLLTAWLPEILYDSEAESAQGGSWPSDVEVTEMTNEMQTLLSGLTDSQIAVMIGKSNGVSDTHLAAQLDCSRPTVIKYRREYTEAVGRFLIDEVPEHRHSFAMEILLELAMEHDGERSDGRA